MINDPTLARSACRRFGAKVLNIEVTQTDKMIMDKHSISRFLDRSIPKNDILLSAEVPNLTIDVSFVSIVDHVKKGSNPIRMAPITL